MRREYKITKGDLGYHVYRIDKREDWTMRLEWLQRNTYTPHKEFARTFYHLDDAVSALSVEKMKCLKGKETPTISTKKSESEERKEKTSWSEL